MLINKHDNGKYQYTVRKFSFNTLKSYNNSCEAVLVKTSSFSHVLKEQKLIIYENPLFKMIKFPL